MGELASVAVGVARLAHEGAHDLFGGEAGGELEGEVAVVGEKEAVSVLFGGEQAAELSALVTLAGGGNGHLALTVERPDALVNGAAESHAAVVVDQVLCSEVTGQGSGHSAVAASARFSRWHVGKSP